jgi:hypothetical protein
MSETIKDGRGRGYSVEVNEKHQMSVDAVVQTEELEIAQLGYAFVASTKVVTLNSTNPHLIFYLKNTSSSKNLHVWISNFGWNGGSVNHNRTMKWSWVAGLNEPTANHSTLIPGNLNFNSGQVAEAICYGWDGVGDGMTYTGGIISSEEIFDKGHSEIKSFGIPILGLNSSIGAIITGEEVGDVVVTIRFFYK